MILPLHYGIDRIKATEFARLKGYTLKYIFSSKIGIRKNNCNEISMDQPVLFFKKDDKIIKLSIKAYDYIFNEFLGDEIESLLFNFSDVDENHLNEFLKLSHASILDDKFIVHKIKLLGQERKRYWSEEWKIKIFHESIQEEVIDEFKTFQFIILENINQDQIVLNTHRGLIDLIFTKEYDINLSKLTYPVEHLDMRILENIDIMSSEGLRKFEQISSMAKERIYKLLFEL